MTNLFWYQGPASQGEKVTGLTWEQAMQLQKQEDDLKAQQEADAAMGPNLNKDIRQYVQQNPSVDPRGMQQGQPQPAQVQPQQTALSPMKSFPDQIQQQPAQLGSPDFMNAVSKITQAQPSGAMSGLPVDVNTEQQKPSASQPMSNEMGGLLTGIPPELTRDLIWQYHNGQLKPSAFIKEVKEIRKNLYENEKNKKNAEFESNLKINEQKVQDEGAMGRLDKQIGSNEKMNTEDNQTQLQLERMRQDAAGDEKKKSLFGGLSGTYANSNDIEGTLINGLSTIPNTLMSKESVNKAKAAYDTYLDLSRQLESLKSQYERYGTELVGNRAEVMKATTRGIQLSLKELENLGVLNGPDLMLMEEMVPNPTGVGAKGRAALNPILGEKVSPMLENLRQRINTKVDSNLQTHGFVRNEVLAEKTKQNNNSSQQTAQPQPIKVGKYTIKKVQ